MDFIVTIEVFATRFLGIFIEAVPFLLLGSLTSGLIESFVKSDDIVRLMPRNRLGAALGGAFLGLAFPVCECGVVPVTRRLFSKGMPLPMGVAFLLAAPFMNPIVFASTYIAFGFGPVFIGRVLLSLSWSRSRSRWSSAYLPSRARCSSRSRWRIGHDKHDHDHEHDHEHDHDDHEP